MLQHGGHLSFALLVADDDHLIAPELQGRFLHVLLLALRLSLLPALRLSLLAAAQDVEK